ncbi:hypothetical protein H311_05068, partial [Anncaliia algerae PRA109]
NVILVDSKKFYKKKETLPKNSSKLRRKRYSDQFKDPCFDKKDIFRKLKMIKAFSTKNRDLDALINKWKSCIEECIVLLQKNHGIFAHHIFKAFSLEKHGFDYDDFCNNSDIEEETNNQFIYEFTGSQSSLDKGKNDSYNPELDENNF